MMVVMALVTTVMAGPLLALIYPRRVVERDVAQAQRAALGSADGHRVLVVVPADEAAALAVVDLAAALAGAGRPATVALARLVPYPAAPLEIGSGLTGGLLEMNRAMGELTRLSAPMLDRGLAVPVLARFTGDAAAELTELIRAGEPDAVVVTRDEPGYAALRERVGVTLITVVAPPPTQVCAIIARITGDTHATAALRAAAQLAVAYGVELVVDAGAAGCLAGSPRPCGSWVAAASRCGSGRSTARPGRALPWWFPRSTAGRPTGRTAPMWPSGPGRTRSRWTRRSGWPGSAPRQRSDRKRKRRR